MAQKRVLSSSPSPKYKPEILLDSGAFSAWNLKSPINFDDYIAFVDQYKDRVPNYINLDVIIPQDVNRAAKESWDNFLYMRKKGLKPIPVYHAGEDISYLHRMLDAGCDYIGISASALQHSDAADRWYDIVWSHLIASDGKPLVKVHAFGEGRERIASRYPWYSVDASTAVLEAARFSIVRFHANGKSIRVTKRRDGASTAKLPHITALSDADRVHIEAELAPFGISYEAFIDPKLGSYLSNLLMSARYWKGFQERLTSDIPKTFTPGGFFHEPSKHEKGIDITTARVYLACFIEVHILTPILIAEYPFLLLSYHYLLKHNQNGLFDMLLRDPNEYLQQKRAAKMLCRMKGEE